MGGNPRAFNLIFCFYCLNLQKYGLLLRSRPSLGGKFIDDHLEDEPVPTHIPTNVAADGDTVEEYDRRRYFL